MKRLKINLLAVAICAPIAYLIVGILSVTSIAIILGIIVSSCAFAYFIASKLILPQKLSVSQCVSLTGDIIGEKYKKATMDNIENIREDFTNIMIMLLEDSTFTGNVESTAKQLANKVAGDLYREVIEHNNKKFYEG